MRSGCVDDRALAPGAEFLVRRSARRRWGSRRVRSGGDGSRCLARDGGGCAAVECLPGEPDGVRQGGPGQCVRAGGLGCGSDEGSAQAAARRRATGVHSRLVYRRAGRSRPVAGRWGSARVRVRSSAPERGQVSSMRMKRASTGGRWSGTCGTRWAATAHAEQLGRSDGAQRTWVSRRAQGPGPGRALVSSTPRGQDTRRCRSAIRGYPPAGPGDWSSRTCRSREGRALGIEASTTC